MELAFDRDTGLIPAIAQDRFSGEIRMVAWMNREALAQTLETRRATFYSRSRKKLWVKGESSGNELRVARVIADCDADVLLLLIDAEGPSCHTGRQNCFFQAVEGQAVEGAAFALSELPIQATPYLPELENVIEQRTRSSSEKSYTRSLLDGGPAKIGAKLREEADELARAIADESDDRVFNEAADLLYHLLVGLRVRGLAFHGVLAALAARSQVSGHVEKASRNV